MRQQRGFTLLELMIVVAAIAILAAIALPSYLSQMRKSRRSAAEANLQQISLLEERYRADNTTYLDSSSTTNWAKLGGDPSGTYYTYAVTVTAAVAPNPPTTAGNPVYFTATATAQTAGQQNNDNVSGASCATLTYSNWNTTTSLMAPVKSPAACWPGM